MKATAQGSPAWYRTGQGQLSAHGELLFVGSFIGLFTGNVFNR